MNCYFNVCGTVFGQCNYSDNPRGTHNNGEQVQQRIEAGGFDERAYQIWATNPTYKATAKPR